MKPHFFPLSSAHVVNCVNILLPPIGLKGKEET